MIQVKCKKCGAIYLWPAILGFPKTCPECGYESGVEDTEDLV